MKKFLFAGFTLTLLLLANFFTVVAQNETAQVSGTITDTNGAVVQGATVTLRSTTTGLTRTVTSSSDGIYVFANIQPGKYEITVQKTGFEEAKTTRDVSVGARVDVPFVLNVSGQKAIVDVVDSAIGEINTTDQQISEIVTDKQLEDLPTISRDPYAFIVTLGNISESDPSGRGVGVSINGQRSASTSILINGGENVDTFRATPGQRIPLDAVKEFSAVTGTFTAEYGRATGGVVNLVTKSGANSFFGSAYIFNRNSELASAGFDANARGIGRQPFNRNDFGFSVGGPVVKNRLLFFNNTEWQIIRSSATLQAWVPTAASINAANINTRNFFNAYSLAATPIPGQTITVAGTGTNSITFQKVQYTVPSNTGAGAPSDSFLSVSRIDWYPTDKLNIFGVYAVDKFESLPGSVSNSPYAGFSTINEDFNQNFQVSGYYNFSSNFISATRFTYNRLRNSQPLGDKPVGPTLYFRPSGNSLAGTPIAFPGYLPFSPGSAIPFGGPQNLYTISQEFTWIYKNHIFKWGGQYYHIRDNRVFGAFQNSVQILGNNNTQAVDNFLAGVLLQFQGAINPQGRFPGQTITLPVGPPQFGRNNRYNEFSGFFMDTWKAPGNFTFNLGLRYEYYGPQRNSDRNLDSNFYFGSGSDIFTRIRNGSVQIAPSSPVGDLWQKDKNNFAPSFGFAYDIEGNGRSTLRGGYAIRYERNFGNVTFNVIQNPPNYAVISVTAADIGGPIAITTNNAGPLAGSSGSVILPRTSLRHVREDIVNAYAHQWSLSYERRFSNNLSLGATYTGTAGRDQYTLENINRAGSGLYYLGSTVSCPPFAATNRLNCLYTNINTRANNGRSDYQGVTFSLESSNLFDTGLFVTSYYTFSKTKDNLSSTFSERANNFNLGLLDPFNPMLDYGNSDYDVRHRLVTSFIYEMPIKKYTSDKTLRALLGDWKLSGIFRAQSGTPFTFYDCTNGITVCMRLVPTANVSFTSSGITPISSVANAFRFISLTGNVPVVLPSTATNPFPGENGPFPSNMTARNAFRGPGAWNLDLALQRNFSFTERFKLALRVDADNVFNRANYAVYEGETEINTLDEVRVGKFGRRLVRVGVRFTF